MKELEADIQKCRTEDEECEMGLTELRSQRDEMQNTRRALFKSDADLEETIGYLKERQTKSNPLWCLYTFDVC